MSELNETPEMFDDCVMPPEQFLSSRLIDAFSGWTCEPVDQSYVYTFDKISLITNRPPGPVIEEMVIRVIQSCQKWSPPPTQKEEPAFFLAGPVRTEISMQRIAGSKDQMEYFVKLYGSVKNPQPLSFPYGVISKCVLAGFASMVEVEGMTLMENVHLIGGAAETTAEFPTSASISENGQQPPPVQDVFSRQ